MEVEKVILIDSSVERGLRSTDCCIGAGLAELLHNRDTEVHPVPPHHMIKMRWFSEYCLYTPAVLFLEGIEPSGKNPLVKALSISICFMNPNFLVWIRADYLLGADMLLKQPRQPCVIVTSGMASNNMQYLP